MNDYFSLTHSYNIPQQQNFTMHYILKELEYKLIYKSLKYISVLYSDFQSLESLLAFALSISKISTFYYLKVFNGNQYNAFQRRVIIRKWRNFDCVMPSYFLKKSGNFHT